ncbi:MAG: DUF177 domain-containing protein [Flavobacteriales bacterium]|nr:DUF177 domain-containing protein [Flavobacteriales bacterium]
MKVLDTVRIALAGLKDQTHQFEYQIDGSFFENFKSSEIETCNIDIELELVKSSNMLVLDMRFNGNIDTMCDSCGSPYSMPLNGKEKLIVKLGESENFDEEVWQITSFEQELEITHFVYECVSVAIPAKRVHPEDACDKGALKNLDNYKAEKESTDPRWDKLKELV